MQKESEKEQNKNKNNDDSQEPQITLTRTNALKSKDNDKNENENENNDDSLEPQITLTRTNALKLKANDIEEIVGKVKKENQNQKQNQNPDDTTEEGYELESDEEKDEKDNTFRNLSKDENYSIKNILVYKFTMDELTEEQLEKIYDLKEKTIEEISKTVGNKNSKNIVKALVSKKKNRFCFDGYDLDLTYITTRIIAMGFPSTSLEGLYRNPLEEVQKFFNTRHPNHYKVYNLCEEKTYADNLFYKQAYFPFKDHEAPPLNLMMPFCEDAKKFLDEDENNIIAVHCKAGKGRTGTFISCLLMYMGIFKTSDECLQYYGMMRVANGKGVTIPSQIRYVNYFEKMLNENMKHPVEFIKRKIIKIKIFGQPMFSTGFTPYFVIENNLKSYYNDKKKAKCTGEDNEAIFDVDIEPGFVVEGDVYVAFSRNNVFGKKEKIFKFWFNTNFIPDNGNVYAFKKREIDKACKDKNCKYYLPGFKIEVHFEPN